jgi:ribosomal protein S17
MTRTVIIRREYLHYVKKYSRYEKRFAPAGHPGC